MLLRRHAPCRVRIGLLVLAMTMTVSAAGGPAEPKLTIGGVVFTDTSDPIRSGLEGVTVTVQGQGQTFQADTRGVIGLWKLDVPEGTYTVTPRRPGYVIEHLVGPGSDGQRSIVIEVAPEHLAANQSIRFLAIEWPEEDAAPAEAADTGRTGGGCAATGERHGKMKDFVTPYAACLGVLLVTTYTDARKRRSRHRRS